MFTNTSVGQQRDSEMVKRLVGGDSWTKALLCVPIPGKGGVSVRRRAAAVTAFTRDYEGVILKGHGEPINDATGECSNSSKECYEVEDSGGIPSTRAFTVQSS